MRTIAIDALDAVELAEIPRVLHERLAAFHTSPTTP
jgi:hypothetical protein